MVACHELCLFGVYEKVCEGLCWAQLVLDPDTLPIRSQTIFKRFLKTWLDSSRPQSFL